MALGRPIGTGPARPALDASSARHSTPLRVARYLAHQQGTPLRVARYLARQQGEGALDEGTLRCRLHALLDDPAERQRLLALLRGEG